MIDKQEQPVPLELLAPARDLATGRAAILAGADAVYIGGPAFGARAAAGNSWTDIAALVALAHQYYARVYVALNTIFFDNEAAAVKQAAQQAYETGVDALIIQDMGLLEMDLPPLPLIASTQTDNRTVAQVKFLEQAGFTRVILARELTLDEIKAIRQETSLELETFVHGALCVSYSGRCYFSQALSGRSANRGCCQQVCRQKFSLVDAAGQELIKDKYLLSTKDLKLIDSLGDLAASGVTSFKIEGRLKDEVYVTNVTAAYRQALDKLIAAHPDKYRRASSGKIRLAFTPDLDKTFNRGYTDYFLHGRTGDVISPENQKSLGKRLGRVKRISQRYFTLDKPVAIANGDGLCWLDPRGGLVGTNVNRTEEGRIYPNHCPGLKPGTVVYRNQDQQFAKAVTGGVSRQVGVKLTVEETVSGWQLTARDEDDNQVSLTIAAPLTKADNPEQAEANWRKQLAKSGGTIFRLDEIDFVWPQPEFVALSQLNEWRRQLLDLLSEKRSADYPRRLVPFKKTAQPYPVKELDYSYNVANKLAVAFYQRHSSQVTEPALELQADTRGQKIMTTKHCLRYFLKACRRRQIKAAAVLREPLFLVLGGKKYRLRFDCEKGDMEVYNKE